uniref:RNA helicase n=1 Tax=Diabrotica virgifera virgifera TaxID=50390 RepID=A0A6P7GEM3_DIAVI
MKEIEKVYEIPASLSKFRHLSFQACLNNAVCMEQFLDYNEVGEVYNVKKPVKNPTTLVTKESLKILSEGHSFKFKLEDRQRDVALGDLVFRDNLNKEVSLRDSLVKAGVLDVDQNLFRVLGIMDFISNYKSSWLTLIAKTCKENPYPKILVGKWVGKKLGEVSEEFEKRDEPLRLHYRNKNNVTDPDEEGDAASELQESSDALDYQSVSNESTYNTDYKENSSVVFPKSNINRAKNQKTKKSDENIVILPAGSERSLGMYQLSSEKPTISSRKSGTYRKSQLGNDSFSPQETRKTSKAEQYRGFPEVLSDSSLSSGESSSKSSAQEDVRDPTLQELKKNIKGGTKLQEENPTLITSKERSSLLSNTSLSSANSSFQENKIEEVLGSTETSLQANRTNPILQKIQKYIKGQNKTTEESATPETSKDHSSNYSNLALSSTNNSFQENEVEKGFSSTEGSAQKNIPDPRLQTIQKFFKRGKDTTEGNETLEASEDRLNISLSSADNSLQENENEKGGRSTEHSSSQNEDPKLQIIYKYIKKPQQIKEGSTAPETSKDVEDRSQSTESSVQENLTDPRVQKFIKRGKQSIEENTTLDTSKDHLNVSLSSADNSLQENENEKGDRSTEPSSPQSEDPKLKILLKYFKGRHQIKGGSTTPETSKHAEEEFKSTESSVQANLIDPRLQKFIKRGKEGTRFSSTEGSAQKNIPDPRLQTIQKFFKRGKDTTEGNETLEASEDRLNISLSSADNSLQENENEKGDRSTEPSSPQSEDPKLKILLKYFKGRHQIKGGSTTPETSKHAEEEFKSTESSVQANLIDPRLQKFIKRGKESTEENTTLDTSKGSFGNLSNNSLSSVDCSFEKRLNSTEISHQENPVDPRIQKFISRKKESNEETLDISKELSGRVSNISLNTADSSLRGNEIREELSSTDTSFQENPIDTRLQKLLKGKLKRSEKEKATLSNISLSSADSSFQENASKYRLSHFSNTSLSSADSSSREDHKIIPIRSRKENTKSKDNTQESTVSDCQSEGNSAEESCLDTNKPSSVEGTSSSDLTKNVHTLKIKPYCECKQCIIWTKDENVFVENFGTCRKVARLEGVKPQFLFKEEGNEARDIEICAIEYGSMRRIEKRAMLKLLVHSESVVHPIKQLAKIAFHKDIHSNLTRLQYTEARRIQSYVWPAILRNHHVFMISGPQTGKTMAYLPAMLTFILEKHERYRSLNKVAGGPLVIILCGSTKKCDEIRDLVRVILGHQRANITVGSYPHNQINTSRTDMLITTPLILVALIKNKSVNFKRLCHLIIEDGDDILNKHKAIMSDIFEMAQSMLKNRVFTKALQLIVCAEQWDSELKHLIKSLQQVPMVCVGSYLEAALYGQVEFSMKFTNLARKDIELKRMLKDTHKIYRSIVLCNDEEIKTIESMFMFNGIECTAIYESLSNDDIMLLEDNWTNAKGGNFSVLVCSDYILNSFLSVTCAHVLIHYSLPTTWTKFVKRYKCLLESCRSPLETKESLRDEEEQSKLKHEIPLCTDLKLFGRCIKDLCSRRHMLSSKLDVSDRLPKSGKIKFKIVNILDVALYSIKILQHVDLDNKLLQYDPPDDVTADLNATLRLGKKAMQKPKLGHHYVFYNPDDEECKYSRCELMEVLKENMVNVKLLDTGVVLNTMLTRLYKLPKEFRCNVRPRAVTYAYLANSIPPFQDESFSSRSLFKLMELMDPKDYKNLVFTGEVHLQLDQTLWLKDVYEEVVLNDTIIPGLQLSREVIQRKLVEYYPDQLVSLYKLCIDAGIILPKYVKERVAVSAKKQEVKKRWAFLDRDKVNEVTFTAAFSPNEIFVRLNKYSDLLYHLQNDIQQSLKKPNYPKLKEINVGGVYLAKDPEGIEYGRVIVLKKEADKALCFYVDFGDESVIPIEELKYIQEVFITKLPFQCIQCRLYGINLLGDTWDEEVINALYSYAFEPGTDIFRSLFVQVYEKENCDSLTPVKYAVVFKDGFGDKNVLVNKLLIDCGMVLENPQEKFSDFEIPVIEVESLESDEELDTMAYICNKTDELQQHLDEAAPGTSRREGQDEFAYDSDEMDLVVYGDLDDFMRELILGPKPPQPALTGNNELPAITAVPAVDYLTPEVYWYQTDTTVTLRIKLIDCDNYKISLKMRNMFNFSTTQGDKTYSLKIMFFDYVHKMEHISTGPEIRVTLTKYNKLDWPRLIMSQQKTRNIHYDINKVAIDDDDDKPKKILEFPKEFDEMLDDLNENDPMYVEYSDLDSDMDLEIENESD